MEYYKMEHYVRFVNWWEYVTGDTHIQLKTLGAVKAPVKVVCLLCSVSTGFPDVLDCILDLFLRSCVVASTLGMSRRVDVILEFVLHPGEGCFHVHGFLMRRSCGVGCLVLRSGFG